MIFGKTEKNDSLVFSGSMGYTPVMTGNVVQRIMVPDGCYSSEFSEKKSRFISLLVPVEDSLEVKAELKKLRDEHPHSRHLVWASVLGNDRELLGLSDDGEPHGTAGRPVLEVLKGSGLTYAAVFVIRYFGGIKLGTGGLVSAYTRAAKDVLAVAGRMEKKEMEAVSLLCSYSQFDGAKAILTGMGMQEIQEEFSDVVKIKGKIPSHDMEDCRRKLRDYSAGSLELLSGEPE